MNVASLGLCRELYELSGWQPLIGQNYTKHQGHIGYPRYDLGFLLRKLQERPVVALRQRAGRRWAASCQWAELTPEGKELLATGAHMAIPATATNVKDVEQRADTPEDAVTKLAIELFKQGIITRDGDE